MAAGAQTQSSTPVAWTLDIGGSVQEYITNNETVYIGTDQNRLHKVLLERGEIAGTLELPAGVYPAGIELTDAYLAVATQNDQLSVYRRSDIGSGSATPVYQTQLTGAPMGIDARDGQLLVGTRETLFVFNLSERSIVWQRKATEFSFEDSQAFGPPIMWTNSGILAIGGQGAAFLSAATGDLDVYITHRGADNAFTATINPPVSTGQAGEYVFFTGPDAHGCCPTFGTMVINTRTREWEFRDFSNVNTPQTAGALTEKIVAYQRGEATTLFRDIESGETFQTSYAPRSNGITTTAGKTFIADTSAENIPTQLVAIGNDDFGIEWSFEFDQKISRLQTAGEYLFGIDQEDGQLLAMAQSGNGTPLRPATQTASGTTQSGGDGTRETEGTGGDATAQPDQSSADGPPDRGFLTNGDGSTLAGVGLRGFSTIITLVSIIIGLFQLSKGNK